MLLDKLPRINLAFLPTPLHEIPNFSKALGGPRLFIKRDDLTGTGFGGNKVRKLEFLLADAKKKGADVIITTGHTQSNHACLTAVASRRLGMKPILVLEKGVHLEQGSMLIDAIIDADVRIVDDSALVQKTMEDCADEARREGHTPYLIPRGGSVPIGAAGYVNACRELLKQMDEQKIKANHLFLAAGSSGTIAGLHVGAKYFKAPFEISGVSVRAKKEDMQDRISSLADDTARFLEMGVAFAPEEITIYDGYVGGGYGVTTPECLDAITLLARTEGIFLDPVYSAKAMSGLIDLIRQKKLNADDTIIFLATGGGPSVFAYSDELLARLSAKS